jgi:hypothetical protein
MNIIGLVVAGVMILCGRRPVRYGYGWCFEREGNWGLELGIFFIAPPSSTHTKNHELGHGIQNIYFGPFTVFVVSIPSVCRFWWRIIMTKLGYRPKTLYDAIWFEGQASKTGTRFMNEYEKEE